MYFEACIRLRNNGAACFLFQQWKGRDRQLSECKASLDYTGNYRTAMATYIEKPSLKQTNKNPKEEGGINVCSIRRQ